MAELLYKRTQSNIYYHYYYTFGIFNHSRVTTTILVLNDTVDFIAQADY